MLVTIQSFGCNWWRRFGSNPEDRFRFSRHAAFYNSTGIRCGRKIRRHWVIPGLIRFNGARDFVSQDVDRYVGGTFRCTEPVVAFGGNRVVFNERVTNNPAPDFFLVVVTNAQFGMLDFESDWLAKGAHAIAASQLRQQQEAMLLMRIGDWVETALGRWYLSRTEQLRVGATLQLCDSDSCDRVED